jgi:Tol biopolymer transport system component
MKTKLISISLFIFILILNACSPFRIATSSGEQPTPVVETMPPAGYQTVTVNQVEVEVGVGSPIPVHVNISGNLPDICSQIEHTEIRQDGTSFIIRLSATPLQEGCLQDPLPFRMSIPLNIIDLPAGSYTATVNGFVAAFTLESGNPDASLRTADMPIAKSDIQVDSVNMEVGVGSPIPVHAIVSGNLPSVCAQLGEVRLHQNGNTFFVRLITYLPAQTDCNEDSIPFRLEVPLNIVNLPAGPYDVNVNGVTASFDPRSAPATPTTGLFQLAYIGQDGNVWLHPGPGFEQRQITADATGGTPDTGIAYFSPQISTDGQWVAYRREVTTPVDSGLQYTFALQVHNLTTGEERAVLEESPAGFAWKPSSHLLAYDLGVPEDYFVGGNPPIDSSVARGIMGYNADTGETIELVHPERGYSLYSPQWSPDGRYLSFDELVYIEGRGLFAYYDFESEQYVAWEEAIGNYAWSPDSSQIIYDGLTYVATGTEAIFARSLAGGTEQRLTDYVSETEYAFSPALAPGNDRMAYLADFSGPEGQTYSLLLQDLTGGEPTLLGDFDTVLNLSWSPSGQWLIFNAGPWESQQLMAVNVSDGSTIKLGPGTMPEVAYDSNH